MRVTISSASDALPFILATGYYGFVVAKTFQFHLYINLYFLHHGSPLIDPRHEIMIFFIKQKDIDNEYIVYTRIKFDLVIHIFDVNGYVYFS